MENQEWGSLKEFRHGSNAYRSLVGLTINVVLPQYKINNFYTIDRVLREGYDKLYELTCLDCGSKQNVTHKVLTEELYKPMSTRVVQCTGCYEKTRREQGIGKRTADSAVSISQQDMFRTVRKVGE